MGWRRKGPGHHQQPWYWPQLTRTNPAPTRTSVCLSLSLSLSLSVSLSLSLSLCHCISLCLSFSLKSPASRLFICLFRRRSKKTSKLCVTSLREGNSRVTTRMRSPIFFYTSVYRSWPTKAPLETQLVLMALTAQRFPSSFPTNQSRMLQKTITIQIRTIENKNGIYFRNK